jgi:membrane protease YdiL (CAAX protease family)
MWSRLLTGLAVTFAVFQAAAHHLGSDRGQAGLLVAALALSVTLCFQRLFFEPSFASAARALGLGLPARRGVVTGTVVGLALLLVVPVFVHVTQARVTFYPGWAALLPGLFAQAGLAEELLFRGFVFGNLRRRYPFRRAAAWSMFPFAAVHLPMFATLPWPVALASMGLAVAVSFPLAWLFEMGGGTVWACALLHFVVQATLKLVIVSGPSSAALPLVWIAACAALPFLVFLVARRR